jgi:hypothetical protein
MKVKIKELYTEEADLEGLSMSAPVASILITDDFDELLHETFLTKSQYEAIEWREKKYQKRRDRAQKCKTIWDILALYGVSDV